MAKRKEPKNPTAADLPQNPEFQAFAAFTGALMKVPKSDVAAIIAAERETPIVDEPYDGEAAECYAVE